MAIINRATKELQLKIVYYGPAKSGKTTNLQMLHDRLPPDRRGRLVSISTDHERTLFFDFLPIDLGQVNGFLTRFLFGIQARERRVRPFHFPNDGSVEAAGQIFAPSNFSVNRLLDVVRQPKSLLHRADVG